MGFQYVFSTKWAQPCELAYLRHQDPRRARWVNRFHSKLTCEHSRYSTGHLLQVDVGYLRWRSDSQRRRDSFLGIIAMRASRSGVRLRAGR
ncbi:uncharacterized protein IUM83_05993 [Phytophthora cinnamomi]|uniref:uncharacterized protein n=1 Tax=Phytophthora cinnamomi TaxID=4785 RepID=UPI00355A5E33|nr:hypothetical protein IUM83_05993 [Phytophthora cinnamomi]